MEETVDSPKRSSAILIGAVSAQVVAIAIANLLPFGFDHPSSLGLDYDHLVKVYTVYLLACLVAVVSSVVERRWMIIVLHVIPVVLVLQSVFGVKFH